MTAGDDYLKSDFMRKLQECDCTPVDDRLVRAAEKAFKTIDIDMVHPEEIDTHWLSWYLMRDGKVIECPFDHTDVQRLRGDVEGFDGTITSFIIGTGALRWNILAGRSAEFTHRGTLKQSVSLDMFCPVTKEQLETISRFIRAARDRGQVTSFAAEGPRCSVGLPYDPRSPRLGYGNRWDELKDVKSIDQIPRFCRLLGHPDCGPEEFPEGTEPRSADVVLAEEFYHGDD